MSPLSKVISELVEERVAIMHLWMTDNGATGTGDTRAIQVLGKNGSTWFSSVWDGTRTVEQPLGGANLSVHQSITQIV
jgi:hypothetical protein